MSAQRSRTEWSWSTTDRITVRCRRASCDPGFFAEEKMSPTVSKSLDGWVCGKLRTSRSTGSVVAARRGNRSPGARYECA